MGIFHLGLAFLRSWFVLCCYFLFGLCVSLFVVVVVSAIYRCFQVHHVVKPSGRGSSGPPSFRSLSSLPDVTLTGRASSTRTKYSAIYARWKRWARDHDLPTFPASHYDFALYLRHLADAFIHRDRRSWHCLDSPFGI